LKLRLWHIARSVLANWFAMAATLAVGFFLAPFIVHRLGNVAYGIWISATSCVVYLGLLDLGMASSVVRYVSKGHTTQDHEGASEVLSAVLWVRLQISAVILLLTGGIAAVFPYVIKGFPTAMTADAREAIVVIGITTVVSMSFGVFSSTLTALNRYDLRSYVTLLQLLLRAGGVVLVLRSGHGIVAIACCELISAAAGNALLVLIVFKVYPQLHITLTKPKSEVLRRIWSYSFYAFLLTISGQLVYQSDNLVVGACISASAVTFYSIGNTLCSYTRQIVGAMTTTFTPVASTYEASGDSASLRALYYNGTRATVALVLPIILTLITRGGNFIGLWMGPQYAQQSGNVLVILSAVLLFNIFNASASSIAWGVEKHKMVAKWTIGEAVANLALSIILARTWLGIYGVAIGTLLPNMVTSLILWPRYVSRIVDVSWLQVYKNIWAPVFLCGIPFAVASYAVGAYYPAHSILVFIVQTVALLPIFVIVVGLIFRDNIKRQILPRVQVWFNTRLGSSAWIGGK